MMKKLCFTLFLSFLSQNSFADEYAISLSEAQRLPPFCLGLSIGNFQDNAKHLKRNIKLPGEHTHHFCHGMKKMLREDYKGAVGSFEYVQVHSSNKNIMLPANSLYKAEALGKLGKVQPALEEYNKAINLKKNYSHAYYKLAKYYMKLKQEKDAIETIKLGLKYSPNSTLLKKQLNKIKGKR
ncbi:MAG: tetratricopeptide repeat protein [Gammaproteobacteria bacterium]|nr:tetratricopeptide repeat protein [Gammaproteobacteria bacterium]